MRSRHVVTTALATLSLLALSACATPGPAGGEPGGASGGIAGCLPGTWNLDTDDLAAQLQAFMVSNGSPITSTTSDGTVTLEVAADSMTYTSAVAITATADIDGLAMVVLQEHDGVSSGLWAVDGTDVVFSDWANGITITTTVTVGGVSTGDALDIPADTGSGVPMTVECSGDSLITQPDGSPFTNRWTRVG